jgi:serine/threonine-protein kinase
LDAKGRVVVTDFGIAKALTEGTITASGSVVGTPYYMSPEQGMGKLVTGASDQYSVAVMAYRMLSGQVPFEGDSAVEVVHKHCTEPPTPLDILAAGLPPHAVQAVHKALEKKPHDRLPSVGAFVDALRRPTPQTAPGTAATVRTPLAPRPVGKTEISRAKTQIVGKSRGRPAWRLQLLVGSIVLLAVAGGWWLLRGGAAPPPGDTAGAATPEVSAPPRDAADVGQDAVQPLGPPPTDAAVGLDSDVSTGAAPPPQAPGPDVVSQQDPVEAVPRAAEPEGTDQPAAAETVVAQPVGAGFVTITGLPAGGMVSVDGRRQMGTTFQLSAGAHVIRMAARGYVRMDTTVTVVAGETLTIQFVARPLPFGGG